MARCVTEVLGALVLALAVTACGDTSGPEAEVSGAQSITVASPQLVDGGRVPARFTCDGAELSPPLSWDGVPEDAEALALVVDDPDAPDGPFTHWVVLDIPVEVTASGEGEVPQGGDQAQNSAGDASYAGPCPPEGTHRYRFTVHALSTATGLEEGVELDTALRAVTENTIAWGRLTASYTR